MAEEPFSRGPVFWVTLVHFPLFWVSVSFSGFWGFVLLFNSFPLLLRGLLLQFFLYANAGAYYGNGVDSGFKAHVPASYGQNSPPQQEPKESKSNQGRGFRDSSAH